MFSRTYSKAVFIFVTVGKYEYLNPLKRTPHAKNRKNQAHRRWRRVSS